MSTQKATTGPEAFITCHRATIPMSWATFSNCVVLRPKIAFFCDRHKNILDSSCAMITMELPYPILSLSAKVFQLQLSVPAPQASIFPRAKSAIEDLDISCFNLSAPQ